MTDKNEKTVIDSFRGEYYFLSNYLTLPIPMVYKKITYKTSEAAYQASKTNDVSKKLQIANARTPGESKRLGRSLRIYKGFEDEKYDIMTEIVEIKFDTNPSLKQKLLDTGDSELIEGNEWGDVRFGMVKDKNGIWKGENNLGRILMSLRDKYNKSKSCD
jgi:ribA/ribD-fused uncharacterized protein